MKLLGIDTGGTFTDFVYYDGKTLSTHKVLSTPDAPERAILQGIAALGIGFSDDLRIVHGSTVATNAVLEGKGAKTVYIGNRGFKDVLTIGRQARKELYNLTPDKTPPPVPAECCLETGGRINHKGEVLEPLTDDDLDHLQQQLKRINPDAVAINLLFSYVDGRFEEAIAKTIDKQYFVARSSKILPLYREYERGITTWLNAYVGPLIKGYLNRLQECIGTARLSIMRSSGNTSDAVQAGDEAVHLLLSGPAGGLTAAHHVSGELGDCKVLTFDMGGTSTDVALIDTAPEMTTDSVIAGYPVGVPMVNIHTIGAGGGSIAYIDNGGLLQVGPESAGATPGPACYGQGGESATVTDANLLLGRIPQKIKLGNVIQPDIRQAESAISTLTTRLGLTTNRETAAGIVRLANEHMGRALRAISVERGIDPKDYSLVAFGGAGGLHVCELAEQLNIRRAILPRMAGVLSAFGMLVAKPGRQLTRTVGCLLEETDDQHIQALIDELKTDGKAALQREGHSTDKLQVSANLDLCYHGQAHALMVPWQDSASSARAFYNLHKLRYGHTLPTAVELVNIRVGVELASPCRIAEDTGNVVATERANTNDKVMLREQLVPGQSITGEKIICDREATIWVAPAWEATRDGDDNIILSRCET